MLVDIPDDTRCPNPSTRYVQMGTYGGTGWCVCVDHEVVLFDHHAKRRDQIPWRSRRLNDGEGVLTTYAAEQEQRTRCVFDSIKHAAFLPGGA